MYDSSERVPLVRPSVGALQSSIQAIQASLQTLFYGLIMVAAVLGAMMIVSYVAVFVFQSTSGPPGEPGPAGAPGENGTIHINANSTHFLAIDNSTLIIVGGFETLFELNGGAISFPPDEDGSTDVTVQGNIVSGSGDALVKTIAPTLINVTLDGTANVMGPVGIEGTLVVDGHTQLNTTDVKGELTVGDGLLVLGHTQINGTVDIVSDTFIDSDLHVHGSSVFDGPVAFGQATFDVLTLSDLNVTQYASIQNLDVVGSAKFNDTLRVALDADLVSNVLVEGNLHVRGAGTFDGPVGMDALTLLDINVTQRAYLYRLDVTGPTYLNDTLRVARDADMASDVSVGGHLHVEGSSTFDGPVSCGLATFDSLTLAFLNVTQQTYIKNLDVTGPTQLNDTLRVALDADLASNVLVEGNLHVRGSSIFDGPVSLGPLLFDSLVLSYLNVTKQAHIQELIVNGTLWANNNLRVKDSIDAIGTTLTIGQSTTNTLLASSHVLVLFVGTTSIQLSDDGRMNLAADNTISINTNVNLNVETQGSITLTSDQGSITLSTGNGAVVGITDSVSITTGGSGTVAINADGLIQLHTGGGGDLDILTVTSRFQVGIDAQAFKLTDNANDYIILDTTVPTLTFPQGFVSGHVTTPGTAGTYHDSTTTLTTTLTSTGGALTAWGGPGVGVTATTTAGQAIKWHLTGGITTSTYLLSYSLVYGTTYAGSLQLQWSTDDMTYATIATVNPNSTPEGLVNHLQSFRLATTATDLYFQWISVSVASIGLGGGISFTILY